MRHLNVTVVVALVVLLVSPLALAQTSPVPITVDPRDYGAVCDGRSLGLADIVAEDTSGAFVQAKSDCNMTSGSAVLTCSTSAPFTANDVGKVIAVYGAGANSSGYIVPLATTIASYQSASQVTLATTASTSVTGSEHVVWGTNDDVALQAAVDALADHGGGVLMSPLGTCLTRGIVLPCADIGNFTGAGYLNCTRKYNGIHIRGVSRERSRWENWDPATSVNTLTGHAALITLGYSAEIPGVGGGAPPGRLRDIEISDLSFWQVKHNTTGVFQGAAVTTYAVDGLTVHDTDAYSHDGPCYQSSGGPKSINVSMHYNSARLCGLGGPSGAGTTGAFTINSAYSAVSNNVIRQSGQCFELGSHDIVIHGNDCDGENGSTNPLSINLSSASTGAWNVSIRNNRFVNHNSGGFENVLGKMSTVTVEGNEFIDHGSLGLGGGKETNNVVDGIQPTSVHGVSSVTDNTFTFTGKKAPAGSVFAVTGNTKVMESWVIDRNTLNYRTASCSGSPYNACRVDGDCTSGACVVPSNVMGFSADFGGPRWAPSRAQSVGDWTIPVVWNGLIYRCTTAGTTGTAEPTWPTGTGATVSDGSAVWTMYGAHPRVQLSNLTLTGPIGAAPFNDVGQEIQVSGQRRALTLRNITTPYTFRVVGNSPAGTGTGDQVAGAGGPVDDRTAQWASRADDTSPSPYGYYAAGTVIRKRAPSSGSGGEGWLVTRAGYAAPAWAASASHAFGDFATATTDNGHFFRITSTSACTSAGSEPSWNTGTGATTSDGTCTWTESGTAVLFTPRP